jgi:cytochrome c oxidase assembly protein subunit 15
LLGGFRVLFDARTLAMIHGCSGPLVFGLATAVAVVTSPGWHAKDLPTIQPTWFRWLAVGLTVSSVIQLILGAQLRHVQPWTKPSSFVALVHLHLTFAAIVTILGLSVAAASRKPLNRQLAGIGWPIFTLLVLLLVQIGLGFGTWIANYAFPWIEAHPALARYTIAIKGYWESWIVTGHQATGSLIIATALVLTLRIWRRSSLSIDRHTISVASPP